MFSAQLFTPDQYNNLLAQGYIESPEPQEMTWRASKGHFIRLVKPVSCCSRIARCAACLFVMPFSTALTLVTCGCLKKYTYEPCVEDLCCVAIAGNECELGYLKDNEATLAAIKADLHALGYRRDIEVLAGLVDSENYEKIYCEKYPQHTYICFYGPTTGFSYLLLCPDGDPAKARFYTVFNRKGQPCTPNELKRKGEEVCIRLQEAQVPPDALHMN